MSNINIIPGLFTDADLSARQFHAVKLNDDKEVAAITDGNAQVPIGILQDDPNGSSTRAAAEVAGPGSMQARAKYGDTVTAGQPLSVDNQGRLISAPWESPIGTADLYIIAYALEGGALNEVRDVMVVSPVPGSLE